jgi:hypothetical protein
MSRVSIKTAAAPLAGFVKTANLLIKWAVVIACLTFIVLRISDKPGELYSWVALSLHPFALLILLCVSCMMFLNWMLEARKWQFLLRGHEDISLSSSLKGVFSGVAAGIFTPNRVGEFAGKIFSLKHTDTVTAVALNYVAGLGQLLITLLAGSIALLLVTALPFNGPVLVFLSFLLSGIFLFLYFNPARFFHFLKSVPGLAPFAKKALSIPFTARQLGYLLFLSLARYLVFSSQFILLLYIHQVNAPVFMLFMLVSVTFLLSTIIPTFALTEIAVRGSMAVLIIGSVSGNEAGILSSSIWLWVINLAVPALIGCAFINRLTFFKTATPDEPYC